MTLRRVSLKRRGVEFFVVESPAERLFYAVTATPGMLLYAESLPGLLGEIEAVVRLWHGDGFKASEPG